MNAPSAFPDQTKPVPPYKHTPLFPLGADATPYKKITAEGVRVEKMMGKDILVVSREALRALSEAAFGEISHYLRPGHLKQLRSILDDDIFLFVEGRPSGLMTELQTELETMGPIKLLVIDSAAIVYDDDEIKRRPVAKFITSPPTMTTVSQKEEVAFCSFA